MTHVVIYYKSLPLHCQELLYFYSTLNEGFNSCCRCNAFLPIIIKKETVSDADISFVLKYHLVTVSFLFYHSNSVNVLDAISDL